MAKTSKSARTNNENNANKRGFTGEFEAKNLYGVKVRRSTCYRERFWPAANFAGRGYTSAYEALLARVSADVKPADIIEKIWVRDIVDLTWEIWRWRKIKMTLVAETVPEMLSKRLKAFVHETPEYEEEEKAESIDEYRASELSKEFADRWAMKDPDVVAWVNELVANERISMDAVWNSAFATELDRIERIDRLATVAESRRNAGLREIERRRAIFAQSLRDKIQKVEDAEFKVINTKSAPRAIKASDKAA